MGKPTGFLELTRSERGYLPVEDRLKNYNEFVVPLSESEVQSQGARCMDCGIPFCHNGCPVNIKYLTGTTLFTKANGRRL